MNSPNQKLIFPIIPTLHECRDMVPLSSSTNKKMLHSESSALALYENDCNATPHSTQSVAACRYQSLYLHVSY